MHLWRNRYRSTRLRWDQVLRDSLRRSGTRLQRLWWPWSGLGRSHRDHILRRERRRRGRGRLNPVSIATVVAARGGIDRRGAMIPTHLGLQSRRQRYFSNGRFRNSWRRSLGAAKSWIRPRNRNRLGHRSGRNNRSRILNRFDFNEFVFGVDDRFNRFELNESVLEIDDRFELGLRCRI